MTVIATTPRHCPGFSEFKNLKSFSCKCPRCGEPKEIFSDEFDRPHTCARCGTQIDFSTCSLEAEGKSIEPE